MHYLSLKKYVVTNARENPRSFEVNVTKILITDCGIEKALTKSGLSKAICRENRPNSDA